MVDNARSELGDFLRSRRQKLQPEDVGLAEGRRRRTARLRREEVAERLTARYAVACDGGRSSVRNLLGLAFRGTESTEYFTMADIRLGPGTKKLPQITLGSRSVRPLAAHRT
jgi:2-polyprenyl-6-methoxyphenol hydroxylase-like FAD-dependent oxidoreductase